MAAEESHDMSALVKNNSCSSSSGDSKQDVEPIEVTLPLNVKPDSEEDPSGEKTEGSDTGQAVENKPLLDELNVNPHHNTPDECLECSCDEALLKGNLNTNGETEHKRLCKNCSLEKGRLANRTEELKVNSIQKQDESPNGEKDTQHSNESGKRNYLEPQVVTESSTAQQESRTESEKCPMNYLQVENASASNFTVGKIFYFTKNPARVSCNRNIKGLPVIHVSLWM